MDFEKEINALKSTMQVQAVALHDLTEKLDVEIPPVGSVIAFAGPLANVQPNYLLCDGQSLPRVGIYKPLFDVIGTSWGGDALNNFNLPDLMGLFLRGVDGGVGRLVSSSCVLLTGSGGPPCLRLSRWVKRFSPQLSRRQRLGARHLMRLLPPP